MCESKMADTSGSGPGWQQQNQGEQPQSQIPWASHAALSSQSGTAAPVDGSANSGAPNVGMANEPAPNHYIVRTRGLPYEATKNEVIQFLSGCCVKNDKDGVHMLVSPDGRPTGEALVELETQQDFENALKHDRQNMGRRYIEVMAISKEQMDTELSRQPGTYGSGDCVVRLRGLPWAATSKDVLELLKDCQVMNGEKGIHFTFAPDGRPSGEAFVELCNEEDVSNALNHNNEHMGRRYVEIFRASRGQMAWDCRMEEKVGGGSGGVVRLRGLPYRCSEEEVRKFFQGMAIPAGGITMQVDQSGRETGEAFVEFVKHEDAENALTKDRQEIGHRYIEVFRSTHAEIRPVRGALPPGRPTPYDRPGARGGYGGYSSKYGSGYERSYRGRGRGGGPVPAGYPPYDPYGAGGGAGGYYEQQDYYGGGFDGGFHPPPPGAADQSLVSYPPIRPSQPTRGGFGAPKEKHSIRMRGLPFSAKDKDITDFFAPLVPLKVNIDFDHYGRPSGEAEVQFSSHEDAMAAMQKNNDHMGHRYIELFLNSRDDMGVGQPGPPPPGRMGGAPMGAGGGAPRYQAPPPPQQQQTGWNDPRMQGRMMGSDMGQQQQVVYDSTGGGGYGQQQPQQQYMGMQQYGGYPQQVATVQQPQQQYGGMVQQATGYGGGYDQSQQQVYQQQPQQQQWY